MVQENMEVDDQEIPISIFCFSKVIQNWIFFPSYPYQFHKLNEDFWSRYQRQL